MEPAGFAIAESGEPTPSEGWSSGMALARLANAGEAGVGQLLEPVRQRAGVTGGEHGGEPTHQAIGSCQFPAVVEQPTEGLSGVEVASGWCGGDQWVTWRGDGGRSHGGVDRQAAA